MLPRSINKKLVEKQIPVEWQMEDSETESESNDEKENDEDYEYLINNNKDNEILNNLYKELLHIDDDENGNKCYSYKCEKLLKTNLEEHLLDIDENGLRPKIYIYAYNVNTSGSYPFLQYFFHNQIFSESSYTSLHTQNLFLPLDIFPKYPECGLYR